MCVCIYIYLCMEEKLIGSYNNTDEFVNTRKVGCLVDKVQINLKKKKKKCFSRNGR